jgi:microcystin-dependent protein
VEGARRVWTRWLRPGKEGGRRGAPAPRLFHLGWHRSSPPTHTHTHIHKYTHTTTTTTTIPRRLQLLAYDDARCHFVAAAVAEEAALPPPPVAAAAGA